MAQCDPRVELQLAPVATADVATRDIVAEAFTGTGLAVAWVALSGDRSNEPGSRPAAEATLRICLRTSRASSGAEMFEAFGPRLTVALVHICKVLPGLPFGLETATPTRRAFFAFKSTDLPASIERGMRAIVAAVATEVGALGWIGADGRWEAL